MDRPEARTGTGSHLRPVTAASAASEAAAQRLSGTLRERADRYRQDASLDLTLLDALVRMDQLEAAADTLEGHRQSLQALAKDLQLAVADAAEERDCVAVSSVVAAPAPVGFRRRMMTLTSAAAVMLALALPMARTLPRTILAGIEGRSSEDHDARIPTGARQAVARSWAESRRADVVAPAQRGAHSQPDVVREPVRTPPAADVSGGSAAADHPPSATVTSLDAVRAARRPPVRAGTTNAVEELAPVRVLHDRDLPVAVPSDLDVVPGAEDLDLP